MNKFMYKVLVVLTSLTITTISYAMSSPDEVAHQSVKSHSLTNHQTTVKTHAAIDLKFKRVKGLEVGDTVDLTLRFKTQKNAGILRVNIRANESLQIGAQNYYEFTTLQGQSAEIVLPVTANQDGEFYIDVSASISQNNQTQVRAFIVPVTVGQINRSKSREARVIEMERAGYKALPSQGVVSMPAEEPTY